jgi:hypothetical protein
MSCNLQVNCVLLNFSKLKLKIEYLREYESILETASACEPVCWKNQESKISWHCPFNGQFSVLISSLLISSFGCVKYAYISKELSFFKKTRTLPDLDGLHSWIHEF